MGGSEVSISVVKCGEVLQCSDCLSNKVSNTNRRLMDNMKLLLICILRVLLSQYFLSMYICFYTCLIMWFIYFYCMTMYSHCMFMYDYPEWGFSSVVRQMPGKIPQRRGTARTLPSLVLTLCIFCVVLCIFVFYVLFVLWRSLYCLCVYVYWTTATGWLPNCS